MRAGSTRSHRPALLVLNLGHRQAHQLQASRAFLTHEALKLDIKDWEATSGIRRGRSANKPTTPKGRFVRQVRDASRGLLILYPLLQDEQKAEKEDKPVLGFAISFPSVDSLGDTPVTYIVGNVYQQQEMSLDA